MNNHEVRKICAMEALPIADDCCKRECPWCGYSCKREAVTLPDVSDSLPAVPPRLDEWVKWVDRVGGEWDDNGVI